VLGVLAAGDAMTAREVAAATRLGRATVSTTLFRLTNTGAVTEAQRGYGLPESAKTSACVAGESGSRRD
jgi:DNA-binding IclR family transcriptional regulator